MKISQISDEHLLNRIKFFERKLAERPTESVYVGDSEYAEQAVEQENQHNEWLAEKLERHIRYMKREAKKRGLETNLKEERKRI
jgi:hypothetical protein